MTRVPAGGTTMPSADFCLLPLKVALQGAAGPVMISLITAPPRDRQTSPDKNVNFPCTTAAFTLSPEPVGFVVSCQLARRLSPGTRLRVMRFLSVGPHVCAPASSGPILTDAPLPSARTSGSIHHMDTLGSRTRDFHPISPRPRRAYTSRSSGTRQNQPRPLALTFGT